MSGSLTSGLEIDTITIDPVPQKKGIILRHVEYLVKSEQFRSEVTRRYSDFQALNDLLMFRFPYRLTPRLPPAKLMANIVGVSSDFIDDRRKSLIRWLTIITSHPVFREDSMVRVFLTDNHNDHAVWLRDQFRHFPDEFVLSNFGYKARDMSSPGLRSEVMTMKTNISNMEEVIRNLSAVFMKMLDRSMEAQKDWVDMARELASLSNNSGFRSSLSQEDESIGVNSNIYFNISKELADLGSKMIPSNKVLDTDVNQKILMLVDVVTGYMDMMERHDKGLMKEHKVATEKIGMIKCRDLRGALATDIEMKNLLENNINQHEIVLTDLESRQAFALLCLHAEGKILLKFVSIFRNILKSLVTCEATLAQDQIEVWKKIQMIV